MRRTVILFWSEDRFSCLFCIGILSLNWNLKLTQVISFIMLSLFYYVEFLLLWHWHKHEMVLFNDIDVKSLQPLNTCMSCFIPFILVSAGFPDPWCPVKSATRANWICLFVLLKTEFRDGIWSSYEHDGNLSITQHLMKRSIQIPSNQISFSSLLTSSDCNTFAIQAESSKKEPLNDLISATPLDVPALACKSDFAEKQKQLLQEMPVYVARP